MIAGASWGWWIGFHAVVAAVLAADWLLPGRRRESRYAQAFVWLGTAGLALAAAGFACWIAVAMGRQTALEFVAGYTIETSLSIDNLFVFLVLFEGFRISRRRQRTALAWGVWGAFVLRATFIAAGVTLLKRFEWVAWIFGAFLLYAAWRLVRSGSTRTAIPEWIVRLQFPKVSGSQRSRRGYEFSSVLSMRIAASNSTRVSYREQVFLQFELPTHLPLQH